MKAILGVGCCAVALLGWAIVPTTVAQESEKVDAFAEFEIAAEIVDPEERIQATLDQQLKTPMDYDETPLEEVIEVLQGEYEIPILIDLGALNDHGFSPATEISINIRQVTLKKALELMLRQPGLEELTYMVTDEVLLITTREMAESTLSTRIYRVDDLNMFADYQKNSVGRDVLTLAPLVDAIVTTVDSDSWSRNGTGKGEIILLQPGVLAVSQTQPVHWQIEKLLSDLREVAQEIEASQQQKSTETESPFGGRGRF